MVDSLTCRSAEVVDADAATAPERLCFTRGQCLGIVLVRHTEDALARRGSTSRPGRVGHPDPEGTEMRETIIALLVMSLSTVSAGAAIGFKPQAQRERVQDEGVAWAPHEGFGETGATPGGPSGQPVRNGVEAAVWRLAQGASQPGYQYSSAQGMFDGEMYGENVGTRGKFALGLLIGGLTGVIGTGIGYFLIGPADMNARANLAVQGKGQDYLLGFKTGWEKKTRSKKRNAFVGGGVIGWLVFLTILYG